MLFNFVFKVEKWKFNKDFSFKNVSREYLIKHNG
jgi:hypothetical protein